MSTQKPRKMPSFLSATKIPVSVMTRPVPAQDYLDGYLLPRGVCTLLATSGGSGKTTSGVSAAIAGAAGKTFRFFGQRDYDRPVLAAIVSGEETQLMFARKVQHELNGTADYQAADEAESIALISVGLIGEASDLRRTVNADLLNVARTPFQKYALSISGSDMHPAGLAALLPADYVEVLLADPLTVSPRTPSTTVELPRAGIDVVGLTPDGRKVAPNGQPSNPLPLQTNRSPSRIADLRQRPSVTFLEAVSAVRYLHAWETGSQAKAAIGRWFTFYNHQRPYTAHGGQPPAVVYWNSIETDRQA